MYQHISTLLIILVRDIVITEWKELEIVDVLTTALTVAARMIGTESDQTRLCKFIFTFQVR